MGRTFTGSGGTIVAGGTGARYSGMIEPDIGPVGSDVTIIADITGRQMGGALASRCRAVMTTGTGPKD